MMRKMSLTKNVRRSEGVPLDRLSKVADAMLGVLSELMGEEARCAIMLSDGGR
jgi:hypothetical protein